MWKPSKRIVFYTESALNDVAILWCKGLLWYCERCLSLDKSLVCIKENSSTKNSGEVEFKT